MILKNIYHSTEKLSADALRLALVTASMEYYKKYVEGNQDFDNSEQIKEELDKLEAAGLGGTKNADTLGLFSSLRSISQL